MQTKRNRVHDFNRYIVAKMTSATTAKAFSSWRTATLVKRESVKKACGFVRRRTNCRRGVTAGRRHGDDARHRDNACFSPCAS